MNNSYKDKLEKEKDLRGQTRSVIKDMLFKALGLVFLAGLILAFFGWIIGNDRIINAGTLTAFVCLVLHSVLYLSEWIKYKKARKKLKDEGWFDV